MSVGFDFAAVVDDDDTSALFFVVVDVEFLAVVPEAVEAVDDADADFDAADDDDADVDVLINAIIFATDHI